MLFRRLSGEEEIQFKTWARENYVTGSDISEIWHPVVQDECRKMNRQTKPMATVVQDKVWESIEYPITLGYALPDGTKLSVVIQNEEESEEEYDKMFQLCGQNVSFSVD